MIEALNSRVKSRILKFLSANRGKEFIISEIAALTGISKSRAFETLKELEERGILRSRAFGRSVAYSLNLGSLHTRDVLVFIEGSEGNVRSMLEEFVKGCKEQFGKNLACIVLFGSYARGNYRETSDIDLLVIARGLPEGLERREKVLDGIENRFLEKHHVSVQAILTTPEELEWHAKWPNPLFYGILLGYKVLYNSGFFEGIIGIVKKKVREKKPIYVEGGREWKLARII